ncbi:MAG TPA: glycosyltransferase family 4 protein [Pirellulales bacterium]|nr:glycosyltransferase family 4 protein [Pirellulales bacterium]
MRIGLVIESLLPQRGGAEHWTWQFAQRLVRAGHEVHAVAAQFSPETERIGVIPHPLEPVTSRITFAQAAERILDELSLDVTHDMGCGWHCDLFQPHGGSRSAAFEQNLLLLPSWLRPIKRTTARWLPRYREFRQLTMGQYMAENRLFIALSKMVARDFERYHGVRRDQLRLVYNGVDVERFSPEHRWRYRRVVRDELGLDDDDTLLLIVAHNFRLKGVPSLLTAVGKLLAEGERVRLAVVGGKRRASLLRMAERRGAAAAVTFVGPVDDATAYYAAADVYVQPTFYDPCSLVVLEALASGLPVVTSLFNGAGELITEGKHGFLVNDPGNAEELVEALRPLLDEHVRDRMGRAARQLAMNHSLERNCQEIMAIYEEIAGRRRQEAA